MEVAPRARFKEFNHATNKLLYTLSLEASEYSGYYVVSYKVPATLMATLARVEIYEGDTLVSNQYIESVVSYASYIIANSSAPSEITLCRYIKEFVSKTTAYFNALYHAEA